MPFRSTPLYHWVSTAAFVVALVAIGAFVSVAQQRTRERHAEEEGVRRAALLAVVVEAAAESTPKASAFDSVVEGIARGVPGGMHVVISGRVLGLGPHGDWCGGHVGTSAAGCVASQARPSLEAAVRAVQRNESGAIAIPTDADHVATAFVAIPRIAGGVVITLTSDTAAIGAAAGAYAAAAALAISVVYAVLLHASDNLAAQAGAGRVAGIVLVHVVQFVPFALVAIVATLGGPVVDVARVQHRDLAIDTLGAVKGSVSVLSQQLGPATATTAVDALAQFHVNSLEASGTTALWIAGLTESAGAAMQRRDPTTVPPVLLEGDVAIIADTLGPESRRTVYASVAEQGTSEVDDDAMAFGLGTTALLGVVFAAAMPRFTLGGWSRWRRGTFPHFVSARNPGPIAVTAALIVAALIPTAAMLQQATAAREGVAASAEIAALAQQACTRAVDWARYERSLAGRASFGASGVFAAVVSAPSTLPAEVATDLLSLDGLDATRTERAAIVAELRANASTLFTVSAESIVAMSGGLDDALAGGVAVLGFQRALHTHLWRGVASTVTQQSATTRAAGQSAASLLSDAGFIGLSTELTTGVTASEARADAIRRINTYTSAPGATAREQAVSKINAASLAEALDRVEQEVQTADRALRNAASWKSPVAAQREVTLDVARAGYAAIVTIGLFGVIVVFGSGGVGAIRPIAAVVVVTIVLCFVLRAVTTETLHALDRWSDPSPAQAVGSSEWAVSCKAVATQHLCETAGIIGALASNMTLPGTLGNRCAGTGAQTLMNQRVNAAAEANSPTAAGILTAVESTETAVDTLVTHLAAVCPAGNVSAAKYAVAEWRTAIRAMPFRTTDVGSALAFTASNHTVLGGTLSRLGCGQASANVTSATFAADVELRQTLAAAVEPSWSSALAAAQTHSFDPVDMAVDAGRFDGAAGSHHVDAIAWTAILGLWVAAAAAAYSHRATYKAVLHRDNSDDVVSLE